MLIPPKIVGKEYWTRAYFYNIDHVDEISDAINYGFYSIGKGKYFDPLSKASEKKVNDCLIKYQGQATTVIKEYQRSGLPKLTSTEQAAAIHEIYANCAEVFHGEVNTDCSIIPDSYLTFKIALQTLNNLDTGTIEERKVFGGHVVLGNLLFLVVPSIGTALRVKV